MPAVEFIRAHTLASGKFADKLSEGSSPRVHHAQATNAEGGRLDLELRIEERIWVPRARLMELAPSAYRLEDSEADATRRDKEAFAAWLSRSYVRVELPNEFVELFGSTKLKEFFSGVAKKYSEQIQGIYLDLRPRSDDSDAQYSPTQVAKFEGPYQLRVTIVVQDPAAVEAVETELKALVDKRIPAAGGKVSRLKASAEKGIDLITDVVTIDGWTVRDLMGNIRFTDWDHLSGTDESDP